MIDVVEPFFKVMVELGYDRSIKPWEPTPARLIPTLNPATVAGDLVNAVGEGINNALAVIGAKAPEIPAASAGDAAQSDISEQTTPKEEAPNPTSPTNTATAPDKAMSTEPAPGIERRSTHTATSTKDDSETVKADEPSTEPTAVDALKPSAGASPSGSAKPSVRPATPRSVVRGPFGVLEKLRDPSHRPAWRRTDHARRAHRRQGGDGRRLPWRRRRGFLTIGVI